MSNQNNEQGKTKKKVGTALKVGITACALVAALGVSYVVYAEQYTQKFIEGTSINQIDVSNMTAEEVEAAIKDRVEDYSITLTFADGKEETISGSDIGLTYSSSNEVDSILAAQNKYSWIQGKLLGTTSDYTVDEAYEYDEDRLKEVVSALPELQEENMTAPVNAYMQLGDDNRFTIVPEDDGSMLKADTVIEAVNQAVSEGADTLDVTSIDDVYAKAEIRSDNEELNTQVNDLNGFLDVTITYQLHDGSTDHVVDANITKSWLAKSPDDENFYYIDVNRLQTLCAQYVEQLAAIDDDVKKTTTFHSTNKGDIELEGEEYGYRIDQSAEAEALYNDLVTKTSETRTPVYSLSQESGGFGDTYVEVDIDNQHVYVHQNGSVVFDTACVTGLASNPDRATPTGVYQIYWKTTDRDLKGPIDPSTGLPTYTSHVNFWMPFYKGYGLHDSSWRSTYGGTIYQSSGSHGCVNLPYDAAQTIYNLISVGTYVIII